MKASIGKYKIAWSDINLSAKQVATIDSSDQRKI
jgi:hypothetical protein